MAVPNTFATDTTPIPLSQLDANFAYYDSAFSISGTSITFPGTLTLSGGTANGVAYLNGSKVLTTGSALTFDGTNLGIGTSSPIAVTGTTLDIAGASGASQRWRNNAGTSSAYLETTSGITNFGTVSSTPLAFMVGAGEQMRLTSTGLGIGTSSPTQKLDVVGVLQSKDAASPTHVGQFGIASSLLITGTTTNTPYTFWTNSTERMRLDSSGNLGLGVTPSAWSSGWKAINLGNYSAFASDAVNDGALSIANNAYASAATTWNYISPLSSGAGRYAINGATHKWFTAPSGTAGDAISFTQALSVGHGTSLALQGATSQSGTGITFPASQNASSNANTLDDYEEGTWTPAVNLLGTLTYNSQSGLYTKIGNLVTVTFGIVVASTDTTQDATQLEISGFPFTCSASSTAKMLTEKWYAADSASRTFNVYLGSGSSTASVQIEQWNGAVGNGSYYSAATRAVYKGGFLICAVTFSYRV